MKLLVKLILITSRLFLASLIMAHEGHKHAEQLDQTSQGDRLVSRDLITFMRSRNVQFDAKRVKPSTQLYGFFDGVDVTKYCVPKLLEIAMIYLS